MTKDEADEAQNPQRSRKWEKRTGIESGNGLSKVCGWTRGKMEGFAAMCMLSLCLKTPLLLESSREFATSVQTVSGQGGVLGAS